MKVLTFLAVFISFLTMNAQEIAILKYNGGGDWYANPTALPNLIKFCNTHIGTALTEKPEIVSANSPEVFQYPFLHMTGHGNVFFSQEDADNLRTYLLGGGFLHIDDNYGMEPYLKKELSKVFPDKELIELSAENPIFKQTFSFPKGLPKIHEHDGKRPQAFGIFHENKLILLFTFESDLGDGWEDPQVHNDPPEVRLKALQMGANIIQYVFKN
ncbi:DUF4159 domain-containing protein [Cellulophaga baltica]|uniref:DUF4159 domain-containing protein n=1 Tax=Cellulophaga baltica 18 TaxID=1348584 RepID=A0AAU8RFR8_9FLAO|nr:DUF4159 domain-containing protein [Cellulophaga baltica]AIZ42264.1 hypothetical protein M666_12105 [Cellulophaga baltica 18]